MLSSQQQHHHQPGTSPITTLNPRQYVPFLIKTEAEPECNYFPFSQSSSLTLSQTNDLLPQTCGPNPICIEALQSPEQGMEDFSLGEWFPFSNTVSPMQPASQNPSPTIAGSARTSRKFSTSDASNDSNVMKPRRRGRKPSAIAADDEEVQAQAKKAHSVVERRYRDNLNGKILQLSRTLSNISANSNKAGNASPVVEDGSEQRRTRIRKSDIITDAVNYVHQSEVEMRHMSAEINRLHERVYTLEKLVRCEDCVLLKEMVRRSLHQGQQQQQG